MKDVKKTSSKLSRGNKKKDDNKSEKKEADAAMDQADKMKKPSAIQRGEEDETKDKKRIRKNQGDEMKKSEASVTNHDFIDVGDLFTGKANYDKVRIPKADIMDLRRNGVIPFKSR